MAENTPIVSTPGPSTEDPKVPTAAPSKDDEEAEALLNAYTNLEQSEKDDKAKADEGSKEGVPEAVVETEKVVEDKTEVDPVKEKETKVKPEPIDSDKVVAVGGVVDLTEEAVTEGEDVVMKDVSEVAEAPGESIRYRFSSIC
jgi:hypothetical protein